MINNEAKCPPPPTHSTREGWLHAAAVALEPLFAANDGQYPDKYRVSCGFPGGGNRLKRIGECWYSSASADASVEIFISPVLADHARVMDVLAHELVHASLPVGAKHGAPFRRLARAIGLAGKPAATVAGPAFTASIQPILAALGPYPHAAMGLASQSKKQTTRMHKCVCPECGYTARTTRKWLDDVGAPHCPTHGQMEVA